MTQSHDKGQYPVNIVSENSKSSFRNYVNLSGGNYRANDQSINEPDSDLSWPSGSPDVSSRLSLSPVRKNLGSRSKDPMKGQGVARNEPLRPLSASFRERGSSSTLPRENRFKSSYTKQRERSWSPPWDRDPSHRFRDRRLLPSPNKDFDSYSLPELPDRSTAMHEDSFVSPATAVPNIPSTVITTTVATPVSMVTDSSSTITSSFTSPPNTQRDQKEQVTQKSAPGITALGLSPPVRDSGSSLTTVTSLTDQAALSSARDSASVDRRRLSFDLGFLDILTIDSNSSIADQLSTGRVS